jgi:hypothetical protein
MSGGFNLKQERRIIMLENELRATIAKLVEKEEEEKRLKGEI